MPTEEELRKLAAARVKRRKEFWAHLLAYVLVNAFLVGMWYLNGAGYFWPGWVLGGWGIGLAFNAWAAFGGGTEATEAEVQREMDKMKGG